MPSFLSPVFGAGAQLFDNQGRVLSGGKLYTYVGGTTTPTATFTNNTDLVTNPNPLILDSAGRIPTEIWLEEGIATKFILTDANNNVLGTWDNVEGVNDITTFVTAAEWQNVAGTPSYISSTSFSISGNLITTFTTNRRLMLSVTAGTIYGYVVSSSFGGGITTVVVKPDSTPLDSGLSQVMVGLLNAANSSVPQQYLAANASVNVASATTTLIGAALSVNVIITGTTTITAFDTVVSGILRFAKFADVLTLTHNATSLILPGGIDLITAAGDQAIFRSLGSGNWECIFYQPIRTKLGDEWLNYGITPTYVSATSFTVTGDQTSIFVANRRVRFIVTAGVGYGYVESSSFGGVSTTVVINPDSTSLDSGLSMMSVSALNSINPSVPQQYMGASAAVSVASATTTPIGDATSVNVTITGTTTITAFDNVLAGIIRFAKFTGALTLTHSAGLVLPGSVNITTANGDQAIFRSLGSGNWECVNYQKIGFSPDTSFVGFTAITATNPTWTPNPRTRALFVICIGGGGNGGNGKNGGGGGGGGGGAGSVAFGTITPVSGTYNATVGAASGTTSFGSISALGGTSGATATSLTGGVGGTTVVSNGTAGAGYVGGTAGSVPAITTGGNAGNGNGGGGAGGGGAGGVPIFVYIYGAGSGGQGALGSTHFDGTAATANSGCGGGGGGGLVTGDPAGSGGAGGTGVILVWEFE